MLTISEGSLSCPAYLALPEKKSPTPALILIHEIWGLVEHIKDVAERLAKKGYLVLAPDLMADTGVPEQMSADLQLDLFNPEKRAEAQKRMREITTPLHSPEFATLAVDRLEACFRFLQNHEQSSGNVGVMGFCFGGTFSFALAIAEPDLKAAISFYGHVEHSDGEIAKIQAPILAFYGEQDERLMHMLPHLTEQMQKAGKEFTSHIYPDCGHAFFNDSNPFSYNQTAAEDSWQKSLTFLEKHLS